MVKQLKYLEKEHIYMIHRAAIKEFGGQDGYFTDTDARIESILSQQYPYLDFEKYQGPFSKAAMLWFFFTKAHCFVDGNKRQSAIVFPKLNGYKDFLDDHDGYLKTFEIARTTIPRSS